MKKGYVKEAEGWESLILDQDYFGNHRADDREGEAFTEEQGTCMTIERARPAAHPRQCASWDRLPPPSCIPSLFRSTCANSPVKLLGKRQSVYVLPYRDEERYGARGRGLSCQVYLRNHGREKRRLGRSLQAARV